MLDKKLIELETDLLAAFRAVAEELHFGRAAARLFISQPPLSQKIKRLEEIVGAQLFFRTTRNVSLTPAGIVFQVHLNQLLIKMEVMVRETKRADDGHAGVLTIGLTPAACASSIVDILYEYRVENPSVFLELLETSSLETATALRRKTIDVGVMRPGFLQSDMKRVEAFEEDICLAVRSEHPLADKEEVTASDLADLPLIDYNPIEAPYLSMKVREIYAQYGVSPKIIQQSRMPIVLTLVEAGCAAALAPKSAIRAAALRAIQLRKNASARARLDIVTLNSKPSSTTRNFIDWVKSKAESGRA